MGVKGFAVGASQPPAGDTKVAIGFRGVEAMPCVESGDYRWLRQRFPCVFQVIEDIKRNDHRNISKPLQHFTAAAINSALIEAQKRGIIAIPEVDAIICQEQHKDTVCEIIGRKVYEISGGVTCKVGGVRYLVPA